MFFLAQIEPAEVRFVYPLPQRAIVSSPFGRRRNPFGRGWGDHHGIDLVASTGTPVLAAHEGRVILAEWYGGYGKTVIVENESKQTLYAHLSGFFVRKGDVVQAGDPIGRVGSTGRSTGPHLHFEKRLLINGHWQLFNPARALGH